MKFHKQKFLHTKDKDDDVIQCGSCYPTTIACLLDLELDRVPNFQLLYWDEKEQRTNLDDYLKHRFLKNKSEKDCEGYELENYERAKSIESSLWLDVKDYWLGSMGYEESFIDNIKEWLIEHPDTPYTVSGKSPRGFDHIAIYMNGELYHDPHPEGGGIVEPWINYPYMFLRKIK